MQIAVVLSDDGLLRDMLTAKLSSLGLTVSFENHADARLFVVDLDSRSLPEGVTVPVIAVGYRLPSTPPLQVRFFSRPFAVTAFTDAVRDALDGKNRLFRIDGKTRRLSYRGYTVSLSPMECTLLLRLAAQDGAPITREALAAGVFPNAGPDAVTVYIHYLRKKTEADGLRRIHSFHGKGYALRLPGEEKIECST